MHLGVLPPRGHIDSADLDLTPQSSPRSVHDEGADPGPDVQGDALGGTDVSVVVCHRSPYAGLGGTVSNPLIGTPMYGNRCRNLTGLLFGVVPSVMTPAAPSGVYLGLTSG